MTSNSVHLEHQLKRWMRPDAHLFIRPDWRRFVRPAFEGDHPFALYERKYNPDQPRAPAGGPDGGQWTSGGDTSDRFTIDLSAAGHHHNPRGVFEKYALRDETRAVFEQATTGPLLDPSSNLFDDAHRAYNKGVDDAFKNYLKTNGISSKEMTPDQARDFLGQIFISEDPRIKDFRERMRVREIRRYILRRLRGAE